MFILLSYMAFKLFLKCWSFFLNYFSSSLLLCFNDLTYVKHNPLMPPPLKEKKGYKDLTLYKMLHCALWVIQS